MRASEVKTAIVAAVEGATPDQTASGQDVFRNLEVGQRPLESARERLFSIVLRSVPTQAHELFTSDNYSVVWDLQVYYHDAPGIDDRICADSERINRALEQLPTNNADINTVNLTAGSVSEFEGFLSMIISIEASYRLTAGV